jgi:hypothetical protein
MGGATPTKERIMPTVKGKTYSYTKAGKAAAVKATKKPVSRKR